MPLKPEFLVGHNLQTHELPEKLMIRASIPKLHSKATTGHDSGPVPFISHLYNLSPKEAS
jgi:hypothetical protein